MLKLAERTDCMMLTQIWSFRCKPRGELDLSDCEACVDHSPRKQRYILERKFDTFRDLLRRIRPVNSLSRFIHNDSLTHLQR